MLVAGASPVLLSSLRTLLGATHAINVPAIEEPFSKSRCLCLQRRISMPTPQGDLRAQIRRLLAMGVIAPRAKNQKVYGGRGDGQMCDCCHQPIDAHSIVYEVDSLDRPPL